MSSSHIPSLKEDRLHGSSLFGCACYQTDPSDPSFTAPAHWHDEIEILYFEQGHFTIEINMESYTVSSECLFFVHSGELHRIFCAEPCREAAVVFSPYLLSFVSNDAAQSRVLLPLAGAELKLPRSLAPDHPCYASVLAEFHEILQHCPAAADRRHADETSQLFVKASLLKILGLLNRYQLITTMHASRNESVEGIKSVLSYIQEHYADKIYVRDLASLLNLNEQYFCRFFRKAVGRSPVTYLNEYRIRRALEMLSDTSMSVTEISLECGFHNLGNFLREFRKMTGTTPLQYKLGCKSKVPSASVSSHSAHKSE